MTRSNRAKNLPNFVCRIALLVFVCGIALPGLAAAPAKEKLLAATPPMGWNDWAHYQCGFTAQTILSNAQALVKTGLAARGYNTVTIDDCWMQKDRDAHGNLQPDPKRFPNGMKAVAQAIHAMGLKFGIYEDAGYETCGGFAGSGVPNGGGKDHFLQDTRLFASWGVDYLKLDGCNLYIPKGGSQLESYHQAYAAQSAAIRQVGRPIVFSESAPAYFQGTPQWYDVLTWVRDYGQLWREGTDVAVYDEKKPNDPRFPSVLWNYAYNLPLGRFQRPGNWNDSDFIIGGDAGMSMAESRSQLSLWSMMSAPLILSSNLSKVSPQAIKLLGNQSVIAIDEDPLGRMATLVRRSPDMDLLFKKLSRGDYAIAVLNHGTTPLPVDLHPSDFGFPNRVGCRLNAENLWNGTHPYSLQADVSSHDTVIWRMHPTSACGAPKRTGVILVLAPGDHEAFKGYTRCLAAPGVVGDCAGTSAEAWTVTSAGGLKSGGRCLAFAGGKPVMQPCTKNSAQRWKYTLAGNLIDAGGQCLTAGGSLSMQTCGYNQRNQIWSLPD